VTFFLDPGISRALPVVFHLVPGVASTIWCRVSATTPLIAPCSLVSISILVLAVVLVAISIFGIVTAVLSILGVVTAVIARAHCLPTLLVKLLTARV
jgi:hypothetical protein